MRLNDALGDIQPQPAAGGVVFSLGPIAIEHMGQIVRRNALTGVAHRKYNLLAGAHGADADVALARSELDRIADQVRQHLEQALRVGLDLQARLDIERQVDALFRGQGRQQRIRLFKNLADVQRHRLDHIAPGFDFRGVEQVFQQHVHAPGSLLHGVNGGRNAP